MDIKKAKELIKLVEESDIAELAIEDKGSRLEIKKGVAATSAVSFAPVAAPAATAAAEPATADSDFGGLTPLLSPMSGTFYAAPSPDSPPFVKVGDQVAVGQPFCIIEAMKTFNEIEAESGGTIAKILVADGAAVETSQPLALLKS